MLPISHLLLPVETKYYNYKGYVFPSLMVILACVSTCSGEGPPSTALVVRTLCEPPGPVDNLSFSSSPSMLTFNWDAPQLPNGDPNNLQYQVGITNILRMSQVHYNNTCHMCTYVLSFEVSAVPVII